MQFLECDFESVSRCTPCNSWLSDAFRRFQTLSEAFSRGFQQRLSEAFSIWGPLFLSISCDPSWPIQALLLFLDVLPEECRLPDPKTVGHQGSSTAPGRLDLALGQRRMTQDLLLGPGAAVDAKLFQVPQGIKNL